MNLAFYLAHYPGPGGTSNAVRGLAQALARAGHDVEILCHGSGHRSWMDGGVTVRCFHRPLFEIPFLVSPRILQHLRGHSREYDLVVLNGMFHPDLPALALATRKAGVPYVIAPHGPYHPAMFQRRGWRKRVYWHLIERRLLTRAHGIQLLAESQREYLDGVKGHFFAVPNGINLDIEPPPATAKAGPETVIGVLGRVDAWNKGLDLIMRSFAACHPDNATLIIQGPDWGSRAALERLADRLTIKSSVTFLGRTDTPLDVIGRWHILALPSRYEGFGLTVVEAMMAGTPVLCSAEAGVAEHVQRSGCGIVAEPSVEGLAAGLRRLLEKRSEWPAMTASGREYAKTKLSWDRIASEAADAYQALLARPQTSE